MQFSEKVLEKEINFKEIFKYIFRKLGFIIAVAVIFGAVGYLVSDKADAPGSYSAFSYVSVENVEPESLVTYETVVLSDDILNAVISQTGLGLKAGEIRDATTVKYNGKTGYSIDVTNSDKDTAIKLSAGIAEQAVKHVSEKYNANANLVVKAESAKDISSSGPISLTVLASAAGLLLALFVFGCIALFDTGIKSVRDVERYGYAVIGAVSAPSYKNKSCCKKRNLWQFVFGYAKKQRCETLLVVNEDAKLYEEYRKLRANLDYTLKDNDNKVLLLAPVGCCAGFAASAINLGTLFASSGSRTLVIDCNLRGSKLAKRLALKPESNIKDVVVGNAKLADAAITLKDNLSLLVADNDNAELLSSAEFGKLIESAMSDYDKIVLAAADLTAYADAQILAKYSSGIVPIVKKFATKDSDIEEALSLAKISNANICGFLYKE